MADEDQQQDDRILLKEVRLSFPNLFEPKAGKGKDAKARYSASFLLDKVAHAEQITLLKRAIYALALAEFGDKTKEMFGKGKIVPCIHEGEDKEWAGYDASNMFLSTSSDTRPHVVDRDQSPLNKDDGRPYAGCYVNGAVRLWVQNNEHGKRVNCELLGVQFVKDGEAFGKPPFKPDEFFPKLDEKKPAGEKPKATKGETAAPDDDEIPF